MSRTRHQEFTYQYKNTSVNNAGFCGFNPRNRIYMPAELIEIKSLWVHIWAQYDVSTPVERRRLDWVGGQPQVKTVPNPDFPGFTTLAPAEEQPNMIYIGQEADENRYVDVKVDLTRILDKIPVNEGGFAFSQPFIDVHVVNNGLLAASEYSAGVILLWKTDFTYTTRGIQ
jgi:hypothetical protein